MNPSLNSPKAAFWRGFVEILPMTIGVIPFGLVTGIAGLRAGLSTLEITLMSALVFAGASQLVALQLMHSGAAIPLVLLAGLVVNLRYVMYSSAIARHLEPFRGWLKPLAAFLLVDQNFALTMERYQRLGPRCTPWYFLGGGAAVHHLGEQHLPRRVAGGAGSRALGPRVRHPPGFYGAPDPCPARPPQPGCRPGGRSGGHRPGQPALPLGPVYWRARGHRGGGVAGEPQEGPGVGRCPERDQRRALTKQKP